MPGIYKRIAAAACLIMSAMVAGTVCFGFFMEPVTSDLGFDRAAFSLYFSLITIVGACSLPVYGKLMGRFGTRKIIIFSGIWTGLCMAALSLCSALWHFYLIGCLIGLGFFGCSYAAVPVIVSNWFIKKNGFVMGLAATIGGICGMICSFIFPSFIENLGWQAGYILLGAMVFVLTTPVALFLLHSTPEELGLRAYGAEEIVEQAEGQVLEGIAYKDALHSSKLWIVLIGFILLAATSSVTQHLAAHFVSIGFSSTMAGIFMAVISAGIILTSMGAGIVADKAGLVKTLIIFSAIYFISFIMLPLTASVAIICVSLIFMSTTNANLAVFAPMVTSSVFGMRDYAAIWGLVSMANVLGQAIGAPLWGAAYDLTGSYNIAMFIAAVLVAIACILLVVIIKKRNSSTTGKTKAI